MKNYYTGVELKDLFGKKRMAEMKYDMLAYESKAKERITTQEEIIKAQATVIKMMVNELKAYKEDVIAENEVLKRKLEQELQTQEVLKEYAEGLERKLKEAS